MDWFACYKNVLPYVFMIETPDGSGSGVFFAYNRRRTFSAIATAAHVVEHAEDWKQPIKLRQHTTGKEIFVTDQDRVILLDRRRDSASILIAYREFDLPEDTLSMVAADKFKAIGTEVGWVGYPSIAKPHLCFFTGLITSFILAEDSYLIDGVARYTASAGGLFLRVLRKLSHNCLARFPRICRTGYAEMLCQACYAPKTSLHSTTPSRL